MASELYHRMLEYDYGDDDRRDLMEKVWSGTPWMVDTFTDGINSHREREITEWCRAEFGDEAWPIHGRPGTWHRGGATIHGWTWFGFDTEEKMHRFCERWPDPTTLRALQESQGGDG